jgi:hypothetical protein
MAAPETLAPECDWCGDTGMDCRDDEGGCGPCPFCSAPGVLPVPEMYEIDEAWLAAECPF